MKKVNLINKKVMSTGLAASLLVTSLGAATCYANPTDNDSKPKSSLQISDANTFEKPELEISESVNFEKFTKPTLTSSSSESNEQQKSTINANAQPQAKENELTDSKIRTSEEEFVSATAENQLTQSEHTDETSQPVSKMRLAKKVAKAAASTAIVVAASYLIYKYRAPISEHLMNGGQYIINKTNVLKSTFNTYSNSLQNGLTNKIKNITNIVSSVTNRTKTKMNDIFNKQYLNTFANKAKNLANSFSAQVSSFTNGTKTKLSNFLNKQPRKFVTQYSNTTRLSDTCPINQTVIWECPAKNQSRFHTIVNKSKNIVSTISQYLSLL